MKTTADFLDALRVKFDLPSDGQLADYLGMHRQYISRYRRLAVSFDDEMAMKVADLLETDPAYVVACMHHQRAKRAEEKQLWERIATSMAGVAAALVMVAALPFVELPALDAGIIIANSPALYIMSNELAVKWFVFSALCVLLYPIIMACLSIIRLNHDRKQ